MSCKKINIRTKSSIPFNFSPVKVSESCKKSDTAGISQRVIDSITELQGLVQKWNTAQASGAIILDRIVNLKSESVSKNNSEFEKLYPDGLQEHCNQLEEVLSKMITVVNSMKLLTEQLCALAELERMQCRNPPPPLHSWPTDRFFNAFRMIHEAYSTQLSLNNVIKEEVAHCTSKNEVLAHVASWESQPYINNKISILFESILCESI